MSRRPVLERVMTTVLYFRLERQACLAETVSRQLPTLPTFTLGVGLLWHFSLGAQWPNRQRAYARGYTNSSNNERFVAAY